MKLPAMLMSICLWCLLSESLGLAGERQVSRDLHGAGEWKSNDQVVAPAQQWSLDAVRFDDGELRGRISVIDSPVVREGNVEGKVSGESISGRILDDDGNVLAEFKGRLADSVFRGTYRDRTGELGEWEWAGPPPRLSEP